MTVLQNVLLIYLPPIFVLLLSWSIIVASRQIFNFFINFLSHKTVVHSSTSAVSSASVELNKMVFRNLLFSCPSACIYKKFTLVQPLRYISYTLHQFESTYARNLVLITMFQLLPRLRCSFQVLQDPFCCNRMMTTRVFCIRFKWPNSNTKVSVRFDSNTQQATYETAVSRCIFLIHRSVILFPMLSVGIHRTAYWLPFRHFVVNVQFIYWPFLSQRQCHRPFFSLWGLFFVLSWKLDCSIDLVLCLGFLLVWHLYICAMWR